MCCVGEQVGRYIRKKLVLGLEVALAADQPVEQEQQQEEQLPTKKVAPPPPPSKPAPPPQPQPQARQAKAVYPWNPSIGAQQGDLVFEAGTIIEIVSDLPGDGWSTGRLNGQEGTYPSTYVEEIAAAPPPPAPNPEPEAPVSAPGALEPSSASAPVLLDGGPAMQEAETLTGVDGANMPAASTPAPVSVPALAPAPEPGPEPAPEPEPEPQAHWTAPNIQIALEFSNECARKSFGSIDKDGTGSISHAEVSELAQRMEAKGHDPKPLLSILKLLDTDGSGEIEFDEWQHLWSRLDSFCSEQVRGSHRENVSLALTFLVLVLSVGF